MPHHDGANPVVEDLLDRHHIADAVRATRRHDVEAVVEHHLGTAFEHLDVDLGMSVDPHLPASGEDVDRGVVVLTHHCPVGSGRLRQLVHLDT